MTIQQMLFNTAASSATFDYSFPDEVHYGNGSSGSGGTQNSHYSGDGTMPAISLGSAVQNWDMFFEIYETLADRTASSNDWAIGTNGYYDTNGFLLGFYDYNVVGEMAVAHPDGAYEFYTQYSLPINQWNYVKLEWRGGSSFKIWQKASANAAYTNRYSVTHSVANSNLVYNGTNWNYCSIGRVKTYSYETLAQNYNQQFYGKIRNFALNVNNNVNNL